MKRTARTKNRSTSRKKRRSNSKNLRDDDFLVKALNEKAATEREINIPKCEDTRYEEELLQELKSRNHYNEQEIQRLRRENSKLVETNSCLQKELAERETESNDYYLKNSLSDMESVINYKSAAGKRHLKKITQYLSSISSLIEGIPLEYFKEVNKNFELIQSEINIMNRLFTTEDYLPTEAETERENERLISELKKLREKENKTSEYRAALDRMKEDMKVLRERLTQLKSGDNLKKIVSEQEARIQSLVNEKELAWSQARALEETIREQRNVIEHLKDVISSLKPKTEYCNSAPRSPQNQSDEKQLQLEIANLDLEIQELQTSLQKALDSY